MKRHLLVTLLIAAALIGCDETIYKIELTPKGGKLARTLTVWSQGSNPDTGEKTIKSIDDAELAAVAKAYSRDKPEGGAKKHKFTGAFAGALPNDVGGAGRFLRYESRMGAASSYIERFRGNDRPGEVIEASLKAVDEVMGLLIGYLETELGKDAEFPKLRKFMSTTLRKDLKNLSVYSYLGSSTSRLNWLELKGDDHQSLSNEVIMRAVIYLIERRYIQTGDIPLLVRVFNSDKAQSKQLLDKATQRIAAKAGITDAKFIARLTSLLADEKNLETSFEAYLQTTPQYKKLIKEQKPVNGDADGPEKDMSAVKLIVQPQIEKIVHLRLGFGGTPRLDVQLALSAKPDGTNGKWNAKDRTVTWKGALTKRDGKTTFLPEICFALWSEPAEKFQKAHFGKVILKGQPLMNYCLWRKGLSDDEAKLWNTVLMKHKPGQDLEAAVKASADPDKPMPYIKEGLKLLQGDVKE